MSNILTRFRRTFVEYLKHDIKLRIGFVVIVVLVLISLMEFPVNYLRFGQEDPLMIGAFDRYLPPSTKHLLGTDLFGRDVLAMMIEGLRSSLLIGAEAGTVSILIGTLVAIIAGYKGGVYDTILRTITDNMLVIPTWPIFVIITLYVRVTDIHSFSLILAAFSWAWVARTIRAQTLALKKLPYIDLAKASGLRDLEIIIKEILPNLLPYIMVGFSNALIGTIIFESGVRLLGLGPPTLMTLGLIIYWSMNWGTLSMGMYNIILPPILMVMTIFASTNLINIGLEDQFNPKIKKITGQ